MSRAHVVRAKNTSSAAEEIHNMKRFLGLVCVILSLLLASCLNSNKVLSISETELFRLNYGNFEEQLNLFDLSTPGAIATSVTMRDGFFYVVNGEMEKILSLNSYGDLLSLYYNEDFYSGEKRGIRSSSSSSLWRSISYPFLLTGKISVDSRKYMYAVGIVPKERNEQDEAEKLLYSQVVLRFSSDGSAIDYIGQQGPGGTPFPTIKNIYTTENNELVVVCHTNDGLCVYWFGMNGFLRYQIPVKLSSIPRISPESVNSIASQNDLYITLENIVPDCYAPRLYVKADYYFPHVAEESRMHSGVDYVKSTIYPLNIETGLYAEPLNVSPYEDSVTKDFSKLTYSMPYDFLGITKNNWMFFVITTENGFNVQMVQPGTQNSIKRNLNIKMKDSVYYSLSLSCEGIISALLCDKDSAKVVWWRTDALIDSVLKS